MIYPILFSQLAVGSPALRRSTILRQSSFTLWRLSTQLDMVLERSPRSVPVLWFSCLFRASLELWWGFYRWHYRSRLTVNGCSTAHPTLQPLVVYLDQLWGAARTRKLVETLFFSRFQKQLWLLTIMCYRPALGCVIAGRNTQHPLTSPPFTPLPPHPEPWNFVAEVKLLKLSCISFLLKLNS